MFFVKIHRSYRDVLAVCDSDLIGKKFEEKFQKNSKHFTKQIELRENFYKDLEINEEDLIKLMIDMKKEDSTFNIVGKKSVKVAIDLGIITSENIGNVSGIPYALILA